MIYYGYCSDYTEQKEIYQHIYILNSYQTNLSFCTQSWMEAAWLGIPVEMEMRTAMTVLMHSYNSDMADVEWIRLVNGSINFLPSLNK